jgi:outer membrane protein TolC
VAATEDVPPRPAAGSLPPPKPIEQEAELTDERVVEQVLARNPTLAEMSAAVRAAEARFPQATALDDPTFTGWVAPLSFGSSKVNDSARLELSQKFPWHGKRELRGDVAHAEAKAAMDEEYDARLRLVEAARSAFADYYLAERALEVNREGLQRLDEFKANAETLYRTGKAPQQDLSQVEVEVGRQTERQLRLKRDRAVAAARLNTLMNRPPDAPLPPAPKEALPIVELPDVTVLREAALTRRPDLQALGARVAADRAAVALAHKEFYPDVEAMAAYDSFWQAADDQQRLRPQVGVRVNLPVRLDRRRAALAEAEAQLARRQAALARQSNEVAFEVQQAYEQVRESAQSVRLYEDKILPAARRNVKEAQTAYVTSLAPFVTLIESQRGLVEMRERAYQAAAEYQRRLAALDRAAGAPVR